MGETEFFTRHQRSTLWHQNYTQSSVYQLLSKLWKPLRLQPRSCALIGIHGWVSINTLRGVARILQREVKLCQSEVSHQIVMLTSMLCFSLFAYTRKQKGWGSQKPQDPSAMPLPQSIHPQLTPLDDPWSTLDQYSIDSLNQNWIGILVDSLLIFDWWMSQLTLSRLSADYWSGVDQVSITEEVDRVLTKYWSECQLSFK